MNEYETALVDLERFFRIQNLSEEKITAKNLARMVKKIIRQLTKAIDRQPQISDNSSKDQENSRRMETEFYDFFDDDNASQTSIKSSQASIRDWYSY